MTKPEEKTKDVGNLYESYNTASMFVENTYISEHERSIVTRGRSCGLQIYIALSIRALAAVCCQIANASLRGCKNVH